MARLSRELGRQLGVLIDRRGQVVHVICGDDTQIVIPDLSDHRLGRGKLRGIRCVHTHLREEPLSADDLADLTLLRLDGMLALGVDSAGNPGLSHFAHLLPSNPAGETHRLFPPTPFRDLHLPFLPFVTALEEEIASRQVLGVSVQARSGRAILASVTTGPRGEAEERMAELAELCRTAGVEVLDTLIQRPRCINPKTLMGSGKIREVMAEALQRGADLLVFDQELAPSQVRAIAEITDLKVLDRTQLILDIFARRAHTPDGKVQVELAQLRYLLPRLMGKGTAMSRLMGGVGGRGPGESKLETDRRRVRDRIAGLEKRLHQLSKGRDQRRQRRVRSGIPIVSIVGYTNAGKSTLLNALTRSTVLTEDLLFATLDTATRRLRFPQERELIITDTVGFLRDLPAGLVGAFRATLEELRDADLLLHVIDASNPAMEQHVVAVEKLLRELDLGDIPLLPVYNKVDLLPADQAQTLGKTRGAVVLSAKKPASFVPLLTEMERRFWPEAPEKQQLCSSDGAPLPKGIASPSPSVPEES
ncbi:MAG: GTPase HflX [Deferrisomatales bacterium]|nr:GTPase HflX [Deferrisomatales bacterium]